MAVDARLPDLLLRWERLRAQGQQITPEELCRDCPDMIEEMRRALLVLETINTLHGTPQEAIGTPATPASALDRRVFGDYLVLKELGRGGMGVVYQAYDHKRQEMVAIKTLRGLDPSALYRLKQEFRSLADVSHPNLVGLHELVSTDQYVFFSMELIEGVPFLTHVRSSAGAAGPQTVDFGAAGPTRSPDDDVSIVPTPVVSIRYDRLREALRQLLTGIAAMHALGKIHRDIKPTNVLVTAAGRVVLLDLGLAADLDVSGMHLSTEQHVTGTIAYMAPEQAASQALTPACDCYSIGVMLYEALTGRLPFEGTPMQVLMDKQKSTPTAPRDLVPDVPQDLNDVCIALLSRDPKARPTARAVLQVLSNQPAPSQPRTTPTRRATFVGRSAQLSALRDAFAATRTGQVAIVRVQGRSGAGKSMLAQHFLDQLSERGEAVVLAGKCYERESVPYKALDSLIDALSRYLRHLPPHEALALLPREVNLLTRVFPVLGRVAVVAETPGRAHDKLEPPELRRRAFAAFRELLARLGDRKPLVLFIDDLQWGDLDGVSQLIELFRPPDPPVLLLVACYRSEDAETSPCLRLLDRELDRAEAGIDQRRLSIEPLSHDEARTLALQLFGRDDAASQAQADAIARESGGNPYFVHVLVQCLAADADSAERFAAESALVLDEVLWNRIQALPDEARRLLAVVAASGQPLSLNCAYQAAAPIKDEHGTLGTLRSSRLIRITGQADREAVETYHDRIRETILAHLGADELRRLHGLIANVLEKSAPADLMSMFAAVTPFGPKAEDAQSLKQKQQNAARIVDLAYHFDAAGQSARALPYALPMAEQARSQYALETAEQLYRIAERGAAQADDANRYRIAEQLGHVLMLRGKYPEVAERFQAAMRYTTSTIARARIEANLGELAFKRGDIMAAIDALERGLEMLGAKVPRSRVGFLMGLARETTVQLFHTWLPGWFLGRKQMVDPESERLIIRLLNRLLYAYWFKRGQIATLWTHLRGLNLAERHPPTLELAQAYSIHAPVMQLVGRFDRGIAYAQKAHAIYQSQGDLWGQGQSLNFQGIVLYGASRFEDCIEKAREAVRLLERAGDLWEMNVAGYHISACLYRLGDLAGATAQAKRVHQMALDIGDPLCTAAPLDVLARAGAPVPPEMIQTELERPRDDIQAIAMVMMAEGVRLFHLDRSEEAAAILEKGYQLAVDAGIKNVYVYPLLAWHASALRRLAQKASENDQPALLKRAMKTALRTLRIARTFQNELPHALRECGLIAALQGKPSHARAYLEESLAVADRQKARFEHALSLQARGRIGLLQQWPNANEDLAAAQQDLHALGAGFAVEGDLAVPK